MYNLIADNNTPSTRVREEYARFDGIQLIINFIGKMTRQVGASEHERLSKQLDRLKGIEKSEIRMIEAERHRFRMKYRKNDFPKAPTVKEAKIIDPAIVGSVDEHRQSNNRNLSDKKLYDERDYEAVRSLIFTGGKVDLDKILCLHLLTVHVIDIDEAELELVSHKNNGQCRVAAVAAEESENDSAKPDDTLPCYVVEIQPERVPQADDRLGHRQQRPDASTAGGAFSWARGMPAPSAAGKMPIISTSLYNNLLESHAHRSNPKGSPSLEHLQKYIHTGQMFNQFEEKTAEKLQSLQSSSQRRPARQRSICKHEQYFVCSESFSRDPKSSGNQCRHILICFNTKLLNFVQTVVEVLRNVNREKADSLAGMLNDSPIVAAKLAEMEDFVDSVENFSFVSSPQSFTCVPGYAIENALQHKSSKQPVAKTLILESDDISVYHRVLENIRQSISDFCTKPGVNSKSIHSLVDSDSTISVLSHASTVHRKSSKISFSVEKPVGKIASNESASKSYGAIQQDFHESANARLAKMPNAKKKSNLHSDPDRVILRRMTNSQRILVGQMCAALKTRKINNEGMAKEKIPLPALLKPVLSQQSISYLTQGTIYAKDNIVDASKVESTIQVSSPLTNVTDFVLTKIYHEIIDVESRSQLQNFMKQAI